MFVFIGEHLNKQISLSEKRKDIILRLNTIIKKLRCLNNEDFNTMNLGFKKFSGKKFDVYGIDLGLNNSATMSGERIIASIIDLNDEKYKIFRRVLDNDVEKNDKGIILHFYCKHDEQNRKSRLISDDYIKNHTVVDAEKYFYSEELNVIEESINLNSKYQKIEFDDFEKPKTTVISLDKYEIIDSFIYNPMPTILMGVAGSGKTEILIKIMNELTFLHPDKKILYITLSTPLKNSVQEKCETFKHENIFFETLKSLFLKITKNNNKNYENYEIFENFINKYNSFYNYTIKKKVDKLLKIYTLHDIYSEIYGLIYGSMLNNWDRKRPKYILYQEYCSLTEDYKNFKKEDYSTIYDLAELYYKYCKYNNFSLYSEDSFDILNSDNKEKYDYILIDEVQDLTECQIKAIYKLLKQKNNIILCGDEKQIINPTFFQTGRINKMFNLENLQVLKARALKSNFRNSKSVTELINYYNDIRKRHLPSLKIEDNMLEESKNTTTGNVYCYTGNLEDIIELFIESANSAIIVDEKEYSKLEEKDIDTRNIYTPRMCKGIEFENILVLNLLTNKKDLYDSLYLNGKSKNSLFHYNFNLFYVAITRTMFNMILVENEKSLIFEDILEKVQSINKVDKIEDIDFKYDKNALSFFELGEKCLMQKDYTKAKKNFYKSLNAENVDDVGIDRIKKYIEISDIYLTEKNDAKLAEIFEDKKIYDFALIHYQEINNYKKEAIMCLLVENKENQFYSVLKQNNISIFELYGINSEYDKKIDEFLYNKYTIIKNNNIEMKNYINEINNVINNINI